MNFNYFLFLWCKQESVYFYVNSSYTLSCCVTCDLCLSFPLCCQRDFWCFRSILVNHIMYCYIKNCDSGKSCFVLVMKSEQQSNWRRKIVGITRSTGRSTRLSWRMLKDKQQCSIWTFLKTKIFLDVIILWMWSHIAVRWDMQFKAFVLSRSDSHED